MSDSDPSKLDIPASPWPPRPANAPISISLRPDSTVRFNVKQLFAVIGACLTAAFVSGLAYAKIAAHIDDPNHVTQRDIRELERRLTVLEAHSGKGN